MARRIPKHLTEQEKAALAAYVSHLRQEYGDQIVAIKLFGSKARGDHEEYSDLDVLVVVKSDDWRLHDQMVVTAVQPMLDHDVVIAPLIVSTKRLRQWQRDKMPIHRSIQADGVSLWTRRTRRSLAAA
jgi:predicted nucleotidyltransferase